MELVSLYIENYKQFKKQTIIFDTKSANPLQQHIFDDLNITLFVGENGSGKSTILSFIAKIFRFLQRHRDNITSNFELKYSIGDDNTIVALSKVNTDLFIKVEGKKYFIKEFNMKTKQYDTNKNFELQITYDEIKKYLPSNIIILGFDTDYNFDYNYNYYGDRLVTNMSIDACYKNNAFGLNISSGLVTLINLYNNNANINYLFKHMKFEFSNKIKLYLNFAEIEYKSEYPKYIKPEHFSNKFWNQYYIQDNNNDEKTIGINFDIFKFLDQNSNNYLILIFFIKNKFIYINDQNIIKNNNHIPINQMSTGEKLLIFRICFILSEIKQQSLIIFEEPETHLNVAWSKQLIPLITYLFKNYSSHFLISTHNSHLINCLFPNQMLIMDNTIRKPNFQTFLANETEIKNNLFPKTSYNPLEEKLLHLLENKTISKNDILLNIGESYLKYLIYINYKTR